MLDDLHRISYCDCKPIKLLLLIFTLLSFHSRNMSTLSTCEQTKLIVFDSYGTLIDVNDLQNTARNFVNSIDATVLVNLWRTKQLDYTWLRSLMKSPIVDTYVDFWGVTQDALKFSLKKLEISLTQPEQDKLMNGWLNLSIFPDVKDSLTQMKQKYQLAVLSNGTPKMLRDVFKHNRLEDLIHPDNEISVDEVKVFKPHPTVYGLAEKKLHVSKSQILFVSGNSWDVSGAKSYGLRSVWINRNNESEANLGISADLEFTNLNELSTYLNQRFSSSN